MSVKFSVVIPVFNVDAYLEECLESVLAQTVDDYEVLTIDDGSTDSSLKILKQFATKDQRIKVFCKSNGGVSSARNYGIDKASGEYICFVDGDDIISPNFLESLHKAIEEGGDSSMCGFQTFNATQSTLLSIVPEKCGVISFEESVRAFYDFHQPIWQRNVWNRMYKKSIIQQQNVRFREDIHIKEDGLFVIEYLCASNGFVGCSDKILYFYRCNPNGAMGSLQRGFNTKLLSDLLAHKTLIRILAKKGIPSDLLERAKEQAKSVANWIVSLLIQSRCYNPVYFVTVERQMASILGWREYLGWRWSQIKKRF